MDGQLRFFGGARSPVMSIGDEGSLARIASSQDVPGLRGWRCPVCPGASQAGHGGLSAGLVAMAGWWWLAGGVVGGGGQVAGQAQAGGGGAEEEPRGERPGAEPVVAVGGAFCGEVVDDRRQGGDSRHSPRGMTTMAGPGGSVRGG